MLKNICEQLLLSGQCSPSKPPENIRKPFLPSYHCFIILLIFASAGLALSHKSFVFSRFAKAVYFRQVIPVSILSTPLSDSQKQPPEVNVLRSFVKFTGKHLCQSLFFNKVAGFRPAILLKKKLWHRCFPVNFAKLLRTPFLQNTSGRLLLCF